MDEKSNTLKAVSENENELRVANYIVLFGGRDLSAFRYVGNTNPSFRNQDGSAGEFFSKSVDVTSPYTEIGRFPVNWEHGKVELGKDDVLGYVDWKTASIDDKGIFVERVLNRRNKYVQWISELVKAGLVGTSSEAIPESITMKSNGEITRWGLKRDTLTVTPMESRMLDENTLKAYKAIQEILTPAPVEALTEPEKEDGDKPNVLKNMENNIMDEKEKQAFLDDVKTTVLDSLTANQETIEAKAAKIAEQKVNEFKATLPEVKSGFHLEVVEDESDKAAKENPFKSAGEFFAAVKNASMYPSEMDKRLNPYKAQGLNEAIPSQGGFLVPEQTAAGLYERMYNVGQLLPLVERDPLAGNTMNIPAIDETSRANGSRHGGITTYWLEEAGTIQSSKPKFRQIALKLKKVAALVYATDEQLEDTAFLSSWLQRVVPDELRFATEDGIYNGDGVGKPLGFMNSDALVSHTRENANQVTYGDIVGMWARRWAGANDYVWLVNQEVMPQLDKLILNGTGSIPPRFVDYDAQGIMRMKGRPVLEVEYAAALGTAGDIALFSPSAYQLVDKASGIQSAASIHVAFTTAEQAFRFIYRVDGKPLWNSTLTPFKGTNALSPYVVLSATS